MISRELITRNWWNGPLWIERRPVLEFCTQVPVEDADVSGVINFVCTRERLDF